MKSGIAPRVLASQVRATAGWLWDDPRAREVTDVVDREEREETSSLAMMLAAHFATVGTFVPTDVDARIRHHVWAAMETPTEIASAIEIVDHVASWDPRIASARCVAATSSFAAATTPAKASAAREDRGSAVLSGHDGEWLGVRAGALGRAWALGDEALATRLAAQIDGEVDREEAIFVDALRAREARRSLCVATTVAHNLGDLSRVVEQWPSAVRPRGERWIRLGHVDANVKRPALAAAGALNKAMMALENHRFLALRRARGLRASRDLLLPFGPWFDAWGETVATHPALGDARADVVAALLELHLSSPEQLGCLRALAGIHRATRGGLEIHADRLPARLRKEPHRGRVREALDVTPAHFDARIQKRFDAWIAAESPFR